MQITLIFGALYAVAMYVGVKWAKKKNREFAAQQREIYLEWLHQFDDPETGD